MEIPTKGKYFSRLCHQNMFKHYLKGFDNKKIWFYTGRRTDAQYNRADNKWL